MLSKENWTDIVTIILASISTIIGLIISFNHPNLQILTLTILMVLLPIIYQIGNIISKEYVRQENNEDFNILEESLDNLEKENIELKKNRTYLKNKTNNQ